VVEVVVEYDRGSRGGLQDPFEGLYLCSDFGGEFGDGDRAVDGDAVGGEDLGDLLVGVLPVGCVAGRGVVDADLV
jgi:hypothetical protein